MSIHELIEPTFVSVSTRRTFTKDGFLPPRKTDVALVTVEVLANSAIQNVAGPFPTVHVTDLSVLLRPSRYANQHWVNCTYAWVPVSETIPNSTALLRNCADHGTFRLRPNENGHVPDFHFPSPSAASQTTLFVKPVSSLNRHPRLVVFGEFVGHTTSRSKPPSVPDTPPATAVPADFEDVPVFDILVECNVVIGLPSSS